MSYDDDWDGGDEPDYAADEAAAIAWARDLLQRDDWVCLDLETTGLHGDAEPVSIGVVAPSSEVLLATVCLPHDGRVPSGAAAIHGLTTECLQAAGAPAFAAIVPQLEAAVAGRQIVCYNAAYDRRVLATAARLSGLPHLSAPYATWPVLTQVWQCAMEVYASFVGEWSAWHGSYRYQRLPRTRREEGERGVVADCRAVLRLIQRMASQGAADDPQVLAALERLRAAGRTSAEVPR